MTFLEAILDRKRREREDAIAKAQADGVCLLDADDLCLTHNCGPLAPCGSLTCKHCRGDDGAGEDAAW